METDSPELFQQWTAAWNDLVSFEVIELEQPNDYPGGRSR
jgi:hypothetical protein